MLLDKMLYYQFGTVFDADAGQMPHEVVAVAVWAVFALDYLIAAVAKIVRYFVGGGFEPFVDYLKHSHGISFRFGVRLPGKAVRL